MNPTSYYYYYVVKIFILKSSHLKVFNAEIYEQYPQINK